MNKKLDTSRELLQPLNIVSLVTKFLICFASDIDHIKARELRVPEELDERLVALIKVHTLVSVPG